MPKLGFLGVGWIGLNRMEAIAKAGCAEVSVIADPSREMQTKALGIAPNAVTVTSVEELLDQDLDGIVIATPSALHAEQSIAALEKGIAVFCQKPLARTAAETRQVIESARYANKLLGVDLSYRFVKGVPELRRIIQSGELGQIFSVDMVFHNAYGPDKAWFYNAELSGGGCVIDLGIHLVDLALWSMNFPKVSSVTSRLYSQGEQICRRESSSESWSAGTAGLTAPTTKVCSGTTVED
ncbi:MAG: Gfo/Idh/MocA family protein, partial [Limisphaerales bacterium]